jgi:hypothetical protein
VAFGVTAGITEFDLEPERIAATMRFLCSDDAASINGVRVPIYGAV